MATAGTRADRRRFLGFLTDLVLALIALMVAIPAAQVPIGQVAKIRYNIGPQELKSENGLLVGYVTMNTRDRDEVSVVEDAEALLQAVGLSADVELASTFNAGL